MELAWLRDAVIPELQPTTAQEENIPRNIPRDNFYMNIRGYTPRHKLQS